MHAEAHAGPNLFYHFTASSIDYRVDIVLVWYNNFTVQFSDATELKHQDCIEHVYHFSSSLVYIRNPSHHIRSSIVNVQ